MPYTQGELWRNHPELQKGEVFLTNIPDEESAAHGHGLKRVEKWKTKRMGRIAYDINGHQIDNMLPVFVQKDEVVDMEADLSWWQKPKEPIAHQES